MKQTLLRELGKKSLLSCGIYLALFLVLYLVEILFDMEGKLLLWDSPAFIVGIPASVFGTAYVLTISNPKNFTGFYVGVVMSILLSLQFYLMGKFDQVILYLCIFIPFQLKSLISWRKAALNPSAEGDAFAPKYLDVKGLIYTLLAAVGIIALDYVLTTLVIDKDGWTKNILMKVLLASSVATSFLANFLMIYKKNDSWLCWVLYSFVNIAIFALSGNVFSLVMFIVMLVVNASAQFAWIKGTNSADFGWAGGKEYIDRLRSKRK